MCVAHGSVGRAQFLGVAAMAGIAASLPATRADAARRAATLPGGLPLPPAVMTPANARAAGIAAASEFAVARYAAVTSLAHQIVDASLRTSVLALLADPKPSFASKYPDAASRIALRDALAHAGFVAPNASPLGILPAGTEASASQAPQPFWSTPGSGQGSHHAYPGGLSAHEAFNASIATEYAATYDRTYFSGTRTLDRDTVIGASLYHDVMKSVVFQWRDDGSITDELEIAGTGAHHTLSGAEAIANGRTPGFVIALLSAHAAPSLGDESKVVDWCRAAAMIAGVDPVAYGLLARDGSAYRLAPDFVPIEAFVTYLSDHDYVLTVHAMTAVRQQLAQMPAAPGSSGFWAVNTLLARNSAVELYQRLVDRGIDAFRREVQRQLAA